MIPASASRWSGPTSDSDLDDLGRRLAERWGCDPLVVDAAWLHDDRGGSLNLAAASPERLAIIQEAFRTAEQTPWCLRAPDREMPPAEPRLRILMAEVQARCGAPFVDPSATPHEERVTRQNARLRLLAGRLRPAGDRAGRFLELLAVSPPGESPEEWADRAAMTWCAEPGVGAARISWLDPGKGVTRDAEDLRATGMGPRWRPIERTRISPGVVVPLNDRGPERAVAELWCQGEWTERLRDEGPATTLRAWGAWAALLADRSRLERRLQTAVASLRDQVRSRGRAASSRGRWRRSASSRPARATS